jgi:hypothetical protein
VRFEDLTAVKMKMMFFWVVTPCRLDAEDGNAGIYLRVYAASRPRRTSSLL